ncbi:MAG: glycosyltransferase family 9 protein [Rhodospirillales bacterium]|nr:glycosyltransferase family 9 protein [Rhodospirillales bacterium]
MQTKPPSGNARARPGVPGRWGYVVSNPFLVSALWLLDHLPWPPAPPPPPAAPPRRVLLAMIGNFGDAVIASAALQRIADAAPEIELGLLVSPAGAAVFRGDPRIRRLHVLEHYWLSRAPVGRLEKLRRHLATRRAVIGDLRAADYDLAIDLYHPFPPVAPVLRAAGIPRRIGYGASGCRRFLTQAVAFRPADRHVAAYQAALLEAAGLIGAPAAATPPRPALPALSPPGPLALPRRYAVLHMGAGAPSREWPEANWQQLAAVLAARGLALVFTGRGPREAARCARMAAATPGAIDLADRLDPAALRGVLAGAALLVCLDSFAAHLAALDAVPSVVLTTGVANPAHWRPLNARAAVLHTAPPCLPCYNWRGCAGMACIRDVSPDAVLAAADRLLPASG